MTAAECLAATAETGAAATDDTDLARCLRAVAEHGDREAFLILYDHFAPRVTAYMQRGGASPAQAEDLAQDTLLAVWRKAALFDPRKAGAATWVFTIARNLRIDRLRRERRPTVDIDEATLVDPAGDAETEIGAARAAARLRRAVDDLPPDQAAVVRMSFFEDLPHPAIAERLGIPLGTVKSRLRLAFKKVRDALDDTGDPA